METCLSQGTAPEAGVCFSLSTGWNQQQTMRLAKYARANNAFRAPLSSLFHLKAVRCTRTFYKILNRNNNKKTAVFCFDRFGRVSDEEVDAH